jgi:hypothetical protein
MLFKPLSSEAPARPAEISRAAMTGELFTNPDK